MTVTALPVTLPLAYRHDRRICIEPDNGPGTGWVEIELRNDAEVKVIEAWLAEWRLSDTGSTEDERR